MPNLEAQVNYRRSAITKALQMHPGVREAAVVQDGSEPLTAYVLPDDSYIDKVLGRGASDATTVDKWRRASDLNLLTKDAGIAPIGFNTTGWNSSYTRQPIPVEHMREWVETTVEDILQLVPKTVYEIGCGTGMLLMRIAPHSERYVAVDVSPVALENLKKQLHAIPSLAEQIEIVKRGADNFDGIEDNSFDTVVLNSVSQYFPNASYLTRVLESAIRVARPGGHIYVGDIRSLPLLPAFATSVEIVQAADEAGVEELRNRIRRRIEKDQELVVSPAYFLSLQNRFSKSLRVEIHPRSGRADNEMTRYRYNAILHLGHETETSCDDVFYDWEEHKWTLDEIRSMLLQHPTKRIGIKRIQNARIEKDLAALAVLRDTEITDTAGKLRHRLGQYVEQGVHPQALIDLETESLGFAVSLSWAACRPNGSFDAFFVPTVSLNSVPILTIGWPKLEASALVRLTNAPGQRKLRDDLASQLIAHCRRNLPGDILPLEVALVDVVPRRSDGDIDPLALLASTRNATL
jgi:ubiquinone/menaquinone biosynthesis C-methylase UbiE